jgi:hypothetical protein
VQHRIFEDLVQGVVAECLRTQEQQLLQLTSTNESTRSSKRRALTQKKFLKEDPWRKRSSKLQCSKAPYSFGEAFLSAVCNNAALCSAQEAKATGGKERRELGDSAPAPPSLRGDYSSSVSWKLKVLLECNNNNAVRECYNIRVVISSSTCKCNNTHTHSPTQSSIIANTA